MLPCHYVYLSDCGHVRVLGSLPLGWHLHDEGAVDGHRDQCHHVTAQTQGHPLVRGVRVCVTESQHLTCALKHKISRVEGRRS